MLCRMSVLWYNKKNAISAVLVGMRCGQRVVRRGTQCIRKYTIFVNDCCVLTSLTATWIRYCYQFVPLGGGAAAGAAAVAVQRVRPLLSAHRSGAT